MCNMQFNQPPTLSSSLKGKSIINHACGYSASTSLNPTT